MYESFTSSVGTERTRRLVLVAVAASVVAWLYSYAFAQLDLAGQLRTGLVSDVIAYQDLADAVIAGGWPYVDVPFEHLPIASLAIIVIGWLSNVSGIGIWLLWPVAMSACFVGTAIAVDRFEGTKEMGFAFIGVAVPLLPLVLFRLEPWVGFLASIAVGAFLGGRAVLGGIVTVLATLAKGWPVAVAAVPWRLGRRTVATTTVLISVMLLVVVSLQEGFRTGRGFEGIHTETLVGSATLVFRHLVGSPLDLIATAGAKYVVVPAFATAVNALPGLVLIVGGLMLVGRSERARPLTQSVGLIVLGILLASPLASTQFVWWITPFVALATGRSRRWYIAASLVALASVTVFDPEALWWAATAVARNVLLVVLAVVWTLNVRRETAPAPSGEDVA